MKRLMMIILAVFFVCTFDSKGLEFGYDKKGNVVSIKQAIDDDSIYKRLEWRYGLKELEDFPGFEDLILTLYYDSHGREISVISAISPGERKMMDYILAAYKKNKKVHYNQIYSGLRTGAYLKKEKKTEKKTGGGS